jgi:DNA polymerase-3 subunit beta
MRLEIPAAELADALATAALAVTDREQIRVLRSAHIVAKDDRLQVTCNSLDIQVTTSTEADISESGEVVTEAAPFVQLMRGFADDATIKLSLDDTRLGVGHKRSHYKLQTQPVSDLPSALTIEEDRPSIELDIEDLLNMLSTVAHAISTEQTRYYLNGVYLQAADGKLCATSTDGVRLARHYFPATVSMPKGIIVPRSTIPVLQRLAKRASGSVTLRWDERLIEVTVGEMLIVSKLIDGSFPDVERVIPAASPNSATLDRGELCAALTRIEAVIEGKKKAARCAGLAWDKTGLDVCLAADPEAAREELDAETTGSARFGISTACALDALGALNGKRVKLDSTGSDYPTRVTDPDDPTIFLLVMPMRWEIAKQEAA